VILTQTETERERERATERERDTERERERERERENSTAGKANYFWNWVSSVTRSEEWCHVSVLMLHGLIPIQNRRIIH
jgi:hypothetical protein